MRTTVVDHTSSILSYQSLFLARQKTATFMRNQMFGTDLLSEVQATSVSLRAIYIKIIANQKSLSLQSCSLLIIIVITKVFANRMVWCLWGTKCSEQTCCRKCALQSCSLKKEKKISVFTEFALFKKKTNTSLLEGRPNCYFKGTLCVSCICFVAVFSFSLVLYLTSDRCLMMGCRTVIDCSVETWLL